MISPGQAVFALGRDVTRIAHRPGAAEPKPPVPTLRIALAAATKRGAPSRDTPTRPPSAVPFGVYDAPNPRHGKPS